MAIFFYRYSFFDKTKENWEKTLKNGIQMIRKTAQTYKMIIRSDILLDFQQVQGLEGDFLFQKW